MTWASATITFGQDEREALAERVPEPPGQAPLGALPLDAVDVQGDRRAAQPRQEGEERVRGVHEQDRVVAVAHAVERADRRVGDGLEVLARQATDEAAPHARRQRRASRPCGRGTSTP